MCNAVAYALPKHMGHLVPGGSSSGVQCFVMFFTSSHCLPPWRRWRTRKRTSSKASQSLHSASS